MSYARIISLTLLAMLAFLRVIHCFVELPSNTSIDAASFTVIRLISGAVMLWLVVRIRAWCKYQPE